MTSRGKAPDGPDLARHKARLLERLRRSASGHLRVDRVSAPLRAAAVRLLEEGVIVRERSGDVSVYRLKD